MKDSSNTTNSLAQGKYAWGFIKIGQINSKFVKYSIIKQRQEFFYLCVE